MNILKPAVAGTLESSDAQVTVEPGEGSLELDLSSSVMNQYGRQIKAARVECAVFRSCGASEQNIPWGGVVR